jgi:hypothetical protein
VRPRVGIDVRSLPGVDPPTRTSVPGRMFAAVAKSAVTVVPLCGQNSRWRVKPL